MKKDVIWFDENGEWQEVWNRKKHPETLKDYEKAYKNAESLAAEMGEPMAQKELWISVRWQDRDKDFFSDVLWEEKKAEEKLIQLREMDSELFEVVMAGIKIMFEDFPNVLGSRSLRSLYKKIKGNIK